MRILLAAEEAAGMQVLRMLLGRGDDVVGVLTSRSAGAGLASISAFARKSGVPVFPAELVRDSSFSDDIGDVDLFLNVHSLYKIHPAILARPLIGTFNLHPGPLPTFRGLNAPSWAIYYGEKTHAVTLHWVVEAIDAGPIAFAAEFPIGEDDTGLSVSTRCVREGIPLIARLLDVAHRDSQSIPKVNQPETDRPMFLRNSVPNQGRIDWLKEGEQISRLIRACDYSPLSSPWGAAWTTLRGRKVEVHQARFRQEDAEAPPGMVFRIDELGVWVATGDGSIVLGTIILDGALLNYREHFDPRSRFL